MPRPSIVLPRGFWERVFPGEADECWPWAGKLNRGGYGQVWLGGRHHLAHRVALLLARGEPVPDTLDVLHSCDNPPCCNPVHLRIGTHAENMHDMYAKGRRRAARGVEQPQAKLNDDRVREVHARLAAGERQVAIARDLGVDPSIVSQISRGVIWRHVV